MNNAALGSASNTSGFYGYPAGSVYPGWFSGDTQTLQTVPEPAEQAIMTDIDNPMPAPETPNGKNILMLLGALVVILIVFGKAG
jgi:hypothetical protein